MSFSVQFLLETSKTQAASLSLLNYSPFFFNTYVQEMGRAARQAGERGHALLLYSSVRGREADMKLFCSGQKCLREIIAKYFDVKKLIVKCYDCCSVCRSSCTCHLCNSFPETAPSGHALGAENPLVPHRQPLSESEKLALHAKLREVQKGFVSHPLPGGASCATGRTPAMIRKVVNTAHCIGSTADLEKIIPVWNSHQAEAVIIAVKSVLSN